MRNRPRLHLVAAALVALALVVVATSARQPPPAPLLHAGYVQAGRLKIRYARAGHGAVVLLIHGFGESLVAWRGVFDRLAEGADVIAIDMPGFGLSSKPASGYTNDSLAQAVVTALDGLGVGHLTIVGHSMGGAVAVAVAARMPSRVDGLVLLDAAVVGQPLSLPDSGLSDAPDASRRAITAYESMRTRFTAPHDQHWLSESESAAAYLPADDPSYRIALASVLRQFDFGWLTPARAASLGMPVLVAWGEYDPVFPLSQGRKLAAALPDARLVIIPRSWHRPHEERPDTVAALIAGFLRLKTGVQ
jgi:2-hydroxy-6-oxonona-2,4-dienedioate hydrolase